ncbi:MAG: HAMP domain-containing sensor histidine kinase [Myxococcota bacterium]
MARRDRPVPALLAALLEARGRISGGDFEALLARSVPLAKRYLVRVDDVVARAREGPILPSDDDAEDPGFDPDDRSRLARLAPADGSPGAEFDGAGAFAVRRAGEHRVVGRWVDLAAWRDRLRDRLVASGRIDRDARLAFETEPLGVEIASSAWSEATALARRRFLWKAIPLGVVALLGALVFTLAVLLQRRRAAYIDLRSHLLAAVTHELKTPLASIRALAETLEMRVGAMPEARDYPTRIIGSTERLGFLVDNVLSFARLERGAWKARFAPIAVADLAGWMAGDLAPRAARPVDVTSAIDADLALVADPDLVRLMLSNLVDNAAKYAVAERVAVRFAATADRHGVHLVVSDDGPGLGVRDPARLFEEFERGAVEGVRGTGLGLSICRQVMRLHGGTIRVLATSPRGTSFEAVFPHRPQAPHHSSEGVEPAATRPLGHPEEGFEP